VHIKSLFELPTLQLNNPLTSISTDIPHLLLLLYTHTEMYANNPYAQGGWFNPENPRSINGETAAAPISQPPTYGALPSFGGSRNGWLEFRFHYRPNILNCTVTGPQGAKAAEILTVSGQTTFYFNGQMFSTIQWSNPPTVEVHNFARNQFAGDFLNLRYSSDQTS